MRHLLGLVLLLLHPCAVSGVQQSHAQLVGLAQDRNGTPLGGLVVKVQPESDSRPRRAYIGEDGHFAIGNLPAGPARVTLMRLRNWKDGRRWVSISARTVLLRSNESNDVRFALREVIVKGRIKARPKRDFPKATTGWRSLPKGVVGTGF